MRQYTNGGEIIFYSCFVGYRINAISQATYNHYFLFGQFFHQFFCDLFSIICMAAGAHNGNNLIMIEISIAFIIQKSGRVITIQQSLWII